MATPIDDLTLALIARRTPNRELFACYYSDTNGPVYRQHAVCSLREAQEDLSGCVYFLEQPPGTLTPGAKAGLCAECGRDITLAAGRRLE